MSLSLKAQVAVLEEENGKLRNWVNDLQSGMYINCVYCGHRYGPQDKVPATMAEALKKHIASCPKHPMSELLETLRAGHELVSSAMSHVTHGGPTPNDANEWLERAEKAIARATGGAV